MPGLIIVSKHLRKIWPLLGLNYKGNYGLVLLHCRANIHYKLISFLLRSCYAGRKLPQAEAST